MKVDGFNPLPTDTTLTRAQGPNGNSAQDARPSAVAGQDEARLQLDESRVRSLESQTMSMPEIRQNRVAALQQAIQEGRYSVSSEQIANALLSEHLA